MTATFTIPSRTPAGLLAMNADAVRPRRTICRDSTAGQSRVFGRGEELFAEGDAADTFYKVVSGTVRTGKLLSDGRRQIDAFQLPGDIFGLEGGALHRSTAEAVEETEVLSYRRSRLGSLMHDDPEFGDRLMNAMISSLDRAHDHMVLLGRKTAQERIAAFLLDMAARLAKGDRFDLPMPRMDIADHLGLTIETVSRTLTQIARGGLIDLSSAGRSVLLRNKEALRRLDA